MNLLSPETNVYLVPSVNPSKIAVMIHYDTRGQQELGGRVANEYLRVVQRASPYGTRTSSLPEVKLQAGN
jgi:hypothetical protein